MFFLVRQWVTSGIIAAICPVKSDIPHHFLTHDVKDRVESLIMPKCLNCDTVCMTLWRLKSGVKLCLFCKERANCFGAVGMTALVVAQVAARLWNPRAVNAAFTTGWKFRKWRCPTTSSGLIFFLLGNLAEVLHLEFSDLTSQSWLNCQCYVSAKKVKTLWFSPTESSSIIKY